MMLREVIFEERTFLLSAFQVGEAFGRAWQDERPVLGRDVWRRKALEDWLRAYGVNVRAVVRCVGWDVRGMWRVEAEVWVSDSSGDVEVAPSAEIRGVVIAGEGVAELDGMTVELRVMVSGELGDVRRGDELEIRIVPRGQETGEADAKGEGEPAPSDEALELRALAAAHPEIKDAFRDVLRERFPDLYQKYADILTGAQESDDA